MTKYISTALALKVSVLLALAFPALAQSPPDNPQPQQPAISPQTPHRQSEYSKHHIFWLIPNYREDESASRFTPLTPKQKLKVALDDSFDPTAFLVAGIFAGSSMAQRQYDFGQGAQGFAKYYGGALPTRPLEI